MYFVFICPCSSVEFGVNDCFRICLVEFSYTRNVWNKRFTVMAASNHDGIVSRLSHCVGRQMLHLHLPRRLWALRLDDIKNLRLKLYIWLQFSPIVLQVL